MHKIKSMRALIVQCQKETMPVLMGGGGGLMKKTESKIRSITRNVCETFIKGWSFLSGNTKLGIFLHSTRFVFLF